MTWQPRRLSGKTGRNSVYLFQAIIKAIAILHSDDARDLFRSSFESQNFLQLKSTTRSQKVRAADVLASAAKRSGDKRMAALAESLQTPNESMATGSHFDEVIAAIDDMVATLNGEEETDLENIVRRIALPTLVVQSRQPSPWTSAPTPLMNSQSTLLRS